MQNAPDNDVVELLDEIRELLCDVACTFSKPEPLLTDVGQMIVTIDRTVERLRWWPQARSNARSANDLADLRKVVVVLPMDIRIQLNNAVEEVDLLVHPLHECTLLHVVATADELKATSA